MNTAFSSLPLNTAMLANIAALGYAQMTAIQAQSLPPILAGADVIAQAKTGSGKTAAFGIGLMHQLNLKLYAVQSLVLCPTRELADQVTKELRRLARFTQNIKILSLCGGESIAGQIKSLSHPAHIVVGTPGRLLKLLEKGYLQLEGLQCLVLDEADRMLDMGFVDEIQKVIAFAPKQRQTLLFSATYTDEIVKLSHSLQNNAQSIKTTDTDVANKVEEYFINCSESQKLHDLIKILAKFKPRNGIIFANTKLEVKELARFLNATNIEASALHGDLEQYQRNDVLVAFANHSVPVLVATDVAARGLDIKDLALVVNFGLPFEQNIYTHRIGRTARAGSQGIAATLYWGKQAFKAKKMQTSQRIFIAAKQLPGATDFSLKANMATLVIEAGKRHKIRAGDILGALTGDVGLHGESIGKINIYDKQSYVAIKRGLINKALRGLKSRGLKGKKFSVWLKQNPFKV